MCSMPVGLGAKRVRTEGVVLMRGLGFAVAGRLQTAHCRGAGRGCQLPGARLLERRRRRRMVRALRARSASGSLGAGDEPTASAQARPAGSAVSNAPSSKADDWLRRSIMSLKLFIEYRWT